MKAARQIALALALGAGYLAALAVYVLCDVLDTIDAWRGRS
jgi:hypothetical protein